MGGGLKMRMEFWLQMKTQEGGTEQDFSFVDTQQEEQEEG